MPLPQVSALGPKALLLCFASVFSSSIDCPVALSLEGLGQNVSCYVDQSCTAVGCCSYIDLLQRSLHTALKLDPCSQTLTLELEQVTQEISLTDVTWGKEFIYFVALFLISKLQEN